MSAPDETVTVSRWPRLSRLRNRITTTLYLARCEAGRNGVEVGVIIKGWRPA